jgi:SAM-dependent methyltransferase
MSREGVVNFTGLDLAPGMLAEARKREIAGARWVEAAIEDPPFAGESFDVILACFTLHHLFDPRAFFRFVESNLRPDGWFFILDFDGRSGAWDKSGRRKVIEAAGNIVRAAFARKNRRTLAAQPTVPRIFNPVHRPRGLDEIVEAIDHPEHYELHNEARGVLLPALIPVLVEDSPVDRALARWAGVVDRRLAPRAGGLFQRIAGRRLP